MVLELQSFTSREQIEEEEEKIPSPQITVIDADERYGKFTVEPLDQGFGMTLGNPLRRVLYSSLTGTAVTWVKIDGVLHEYSTIPHVKEEVSEFLLNIKDLRLSSEVDRPGKLRLEVAGEGDVSAADIMASSDFEIVNPELHLVTLDSAEAKLSVEFNVERGKGYEVATSGDGQPIGVLPVDAVFTPIRKVNFRVENTRVGQRTDFERLVIEIWTDGSIEPIEAMRQAGNILSNQFFMFAHVQTDTTDPTATIHGPIIDPAKYNVTVERMNLTSRTLNCLKRAGINKVGEVLEMNRAELLRIRNFGEKSYNELFDRLREMDLLPAELDPESNVNGAGAADEETEAPASEEDNKASE